MSNVCGIKRPSYNLEDQEPGPYRNKKSRVGDTATATRVLRMELLMEKLIEERNLLVEKIQGLCARVTELEQQSERKQQSEPWRSYIL